MWVRHTNGDGLDREQAARLQGITLQGEGKCEDELPNQHPTGDKRSRHIEQDRVDDQESNDRFLVPIRGGPKEVLPVRISYRSVHTTLSFYNVM